MAESTLKKKSAAWQIKLEPRLEEPSAKLSLGITLGAVVVALILGGIVIAVVGGNPFLSYVYIARASFGSVGVLSDTIVKATPIILTALACSIAFRMKLWNIGAEGQFIMGAWGASAIVLTPVLPAETSRWLFIPVMALAGLGMGAAWGFIPGYLKAKFNVNEIISSLMLNYIAVSWVNFWIFGVWSEGAAPLLVCCEEAHRYVPVNSSLGFEPCKRAIAKIAKEGRKYGASLCIVTQRPAEIDDAEREQDQRLDQHLPEDMARRHAERLEQAELAGALEHRHELGIHDSDNAYKAAAPAMVLDEVTNG